MKNLFYFLAFAAVLNSCTSEEDSPTSSTGNRIIQEVAHYSDGSTISYNYTYNGDKLASIQDTDGGNIVITYTGDLVTKMEYYDGTTLEQTDLYEYNSEGKVATFYMISHDVEWGDKEVYVYNPDGTISMTHYIGDMDSQTQFNDDAVISFHPNGEVASIVSSPNSSLTYQYDDKNNPWKNIPGMDKIAFSNGGAMGVNHNMTLETEVLDASTTVVGTTTYTYNAANYPVTSSEDYDGDITTTEYFYE